LQPGANRNATFSAFFVDEWDVFRLDEWETGDHIEEKGDRQPGDYPSDQYREGRMADLRNHHFQTQSFYVAISQKGQSRTDRSHVSEICH
tara:strand:+ start:995 stop:1264 length:270 start_codon:yes stop_codon:yes gene_type:complete